MTDNLISVTSLFEIENEPRIRDTELAERLGFKRAADIRELIARNRDELEAYGSFPCRTENPAAQGGRPSKAYYLNEGQGLVLCALSRTPKAAAVRKMLIDVFMSYRQGKIVHVKEHHRRKPQVGKGSVAFEPKFQECLEFVDVYHGDTNEMLASLLARVSLIEKAMTA